METLKFEYPASGKSIVRSGHSGVVSSGDLEVLVRPPTESMAQITVRTSVEGFGATWQAVLERFQQRFGGAMDVEINDSGATPGMVMLRLEQALESARE